MGCRWAIEDALRDSLIISEWDNIVAYNACVMRAFSTFPDEFFEEYASLSKDGQNELNDKLYQAKLPTVASTLIHSQSQSYE